MQLSNEVVVVKAEVSLILISTYISPAGFLFLSWIVRRRSLRISLLFPTFLKSLS